jgi:hypothetical protein
MKTKVVFKIMGGVVIALFPELAGDNNPYKTCLSYETIGQHGAASTSLSSLKAATSLQYASLKVELEQLGYDLEIVKKFSRKMLQSRIAQCDL